MQSIRSGLAACVVACLAALPPIACAGPLDERNADAHLKAIAAGDVEALIAGYGADPLVDWIGGTLDGRYRGKDEIRAMWQKFVANNDGQPRTLQRTAISQNANPKGATVTAVAEYTGKTSVKVRHVLVYRDTRLISEIWQIDPAAVIVPAAP